MQPFRKRLKILTLQFLALLSVVRGYNLFLIASAQYLAAICILSDKTHWETLLDYRLFLLILASTFIIAAGYIVNNFYDSEKDWINRPYQALLNKHISQHFKLNIYMLLNILGLASAMAVSYRACTFFVWYALFLWFYSHRLKKITFVGNLTAALLSVIPFAALFIYYFHFNWIIFIHACFLFLLLLAREITKDFTSIRGDFICYYPTLPVVLGVPKTKRIASLIILLTGVPGWLLTKSFRTGAMHYYFYFCLVALLMGLTRLYRAQSQREFVQLHHLLRLIIVLGIFSIALIKW